MKGKLIRWDDQKGFGFVRPTGGGDDVFVHISALKKMTRRPVVGDVITFEIHLDNNGKQRAVNAKIEGVPLLEATRHRPRNRTVPKRDGGLGKIVALVLILSGGTAVYGVLNHDRVSTSGSIQSESFSNSVGVDSGRYSCDGKIHCSEMTSCSEAEFYLKNCPGTKLDGDGDGIPCEDQWCR